MFVKFRVYRYGKPTNEIEYGLLVTEVKYEILDLSSLFPIVDA